MSASGGGNVTDNTPVLNGVYPSDWQAGPTTFGVIFSGQYFGTNPPILVFSPSAGNDYNIVSLNDTQIVADATVVAATPDEEVNISITSSGYNGNAFASGGGAVPATGNPVKAHVNAPLNSSQVIVIGWVDGTAPDLIKLPTAGVNPNLVGNLNNHCFGETLALINGNAKDIRTYPSANTQADRYYAYVFLVKNSPNSRPPDTISPSSQFSQGDFRLFNAYSGTSDNGTGVGSTPDPSHTVITGMLAIIFGRGQSSNNMGTTGISGSGQAYQVAKGRIGTKGQAAKRSILERYPGSIP